ncbi:MAG: hypothetical protein MJ168_08155 [Clostridia bacterium]|nr:hypothetical protein [Clostridia bacterium]
MMFTLKAENTIGMKEEYTFDAEALQISKKKGFDVIVLKNPGAKRATAKINTAVYKEVVIYENSTGRRTYSFSK